MNITQDDVDKHTLINKVEKICLFMENFTPVERLLQYKEVYHGCVIVSKSKNIKYAVFRDIGGKCSSPIECAQYFSYTVNANDYTLIGYGTGKIICDYIQRNTSK